MTQQANYPSRSSSLIVWGLYWGVGTSLTMALFNRLVDGYFEPTWHIATRIFIFAGCGLVAGELKFRKMISAPGRELSTSRVWRIALLFILLLSLAWVVYLMRHS